MKQHGKRHQKYKKHTKKPEHMEENKVKARCVLDILGAPKEYVVTRLKEHIDKIRREDENTKILSEYIAEPEEKDKLFTTFAELELEFKTPMDLLNFCFDSMPSSIEVIEPETISFEQKDLGEFLNDFQHKLHHTDMMLSRLTTEKKHLDINTMNVFRNFIKFALEQRPYSLEELSNILGVKEKSLEPFLKQIEDKGKIEKKGDKWSLKET